jgi:hypothetical protein
MPDATPSPAAATTNDLAYANRKQQESDAAFGQSLLAAHPEWDTKPAAPAAAGEAPAAPGAAAPAAPAAPAASGADGFIDKWADFWKKGDEALSSGNNPFGAKFPKPGEEWDPAELSKFEHSVMNHVVLGQPDIAAAGGESSGLLSQIVDRIKQKFGAGEPAGSVLSETPEGTASIAPPAAAKPEVATGASGLLTSPTGTLEATGKAAATSATEAASTSESAAATPEAAATTLAQKQLDALQTTRVGKNIATEFGKPEIATVVPEEQTIAEGQALRANLEPKTGDDVQPPKMAAHVAAIAGIYSDEADAITSSAREIVGRIAKGDDASEDVAGLMNRYSAFAVNYANVAGARSDVARGLQILDPLKPGNAFATATAKLAQQFDVNNAHEMVNALATLTPEGATRMARQMAETADGGGTISDAIASYYKANLLTSPSTYLRIPVDNAITTLAEIPTRAFASAWSAAERSVGLGGDGLEGNVNWREPMYMIRGLKNSFSDAVQYAGAAMQTGVRYGLDESDSPYLSGAEVSRKMGDAAQKLSTPLLGKLAGTWIGDGIDYLGTPLNLVQHGLAGVHTFGYVLAEGAQMHALAWRFASEQAASEGLTGAEGIARATEHYQTLINEKPTELINASRQFADLVTMATELGKNGKALQAMSQIPGLNVVAPFFKVMANQLKYDTQYVGSGLLSGDMYKSGATGQIMRGRLTAGALMSLMIGHEITRGNVTGSLSYMTPQARVLAEQQGIKPYSVKIGGSYYEMPPLMKQSVGIIADAAERAHHMDEKSAGAYTSAALQAVAHSITSTTVMLGLKRIFDGIENPDQLSQGEALERYLGETAAGFIPGSGFLKGAARATNTVERNVSEDPTDTTSHLEGLRKSLMAQFPLTQDQLGPTYDVLGKPILRMPGVLDNMVWPIQVTKEKLDPREQAIIDSGATFSKVPKYIGGGSPRPFQNPDDPDIGVPISIPMQDEWQQSRGERFTQLLDIKMDSPMWEMGSKELKKQMVEQAGVQAADDATMMLKAEHPEILQQMIERKIARKSLMLTPADVGGGGGAGTAAITGP